MASRKRSVREVSLMLRDTRLRKSYLSLAVGPEVDGQADHLVYGGVGGLVEEDGRQGGHGQEGQAGLDAPVDDGPRDEPQRPLPGQQPQAKHEIDGLQYRHRLHGSVHRLRQEIPEYLGPEEALNRGGHLVCGVIVSWLLSLISQAGRRRTRCGCQDDEAGPVVLDKPSHGVPPVRRLPEL